MPMALPGHDHDAREMMLAQVRAATADVFSRTSARVAHQMRPMLHSGRPRLANAALALGLEPRTLRRRLKAEGATFEAIRDDVRFTLARELLDMTDLPIGDISRAVAFSTHGAFVAAFHRWAGLPPREWRARHTRKHPAPGQTIAPERIEAVRRRRERFAPAASPPRRGREHGPDRGEGPADQV
jgi:AraC-like DNA-binding protein